MSPAGIKWNSSFSLDKDKNIILLRHQSPLSWEVNKAGKKALCKKQNVKTYPKSTCQVFVFQLGFRIIRSKNSPVFILIKNFSHIYMKCRSIPQSLISTAQKSSFVICIKVFKYNESPLPVRTHLAL